MFNNHYTTNKTMGANTDYIKDRSVKTISAAKTIAATWVWEEKSIADMALQLAEIVGDKDATPMKIGQEQIVSTANQAMLDARSGWDTALDQLHLWTMQGVGRARTKFRNDPAKLSQLAGLGTRGTSRRVTLEEALAWDTAWTSLAPTWTPTAANTLATFGALRKLCTEDLQTTYAQKQSDWSEANETLAHLADGLEDTNQAWYADATRLFPVGTIEGDMIRSTIPTTYTPPPPKPPVTPVV